VMLYLNVEFSMDASSTFNFAITTSSEAISTALVSSVKRTASEALRCASLLPDALPSTIAMLRFSANTRSTFERLRLAMVRAFLASIRRVEDAVRSTTSEVSVLFIG